MMSFDLQGLLFCALSTLCPWRLSPVPHEGGRLPRVSAHLEGRTRSANRPVLTELLWLGFLADAEAQGGVLVPREALPGY